VEREDRHARPFREGAPMSDVQQCEICSRWTSAGRLVGESRPGADDAHFLCQRCEREMENNSFICAAVDRWEANEINMR
jgi:hypothetical protein